MSELSLNIIKRPTAQEFDGSGQSVTDVPRPLDHFCMLFSFMSSHETTIWYQLYL